MTLNRTAKIDATLSVGGDVGGDVSVAGDVPLIEPNASSPGATITPRQIQDFPVNGREYLDLLQLVPGVAINRQSDGDNASPVLGERSGNNNFFIDGQPNKDTVSGRKLLLGVGDTMLLGDLGDPWIVALRASYRSEPSDN